MIALILPMILNFLGTAGIGSLTKILDHKKELAIEAGRQKNDARRIQLEREISQLNTEIEFERLRVDLGKTDRGRWLFGFALDMLVLSVCIYWACSFWVRTLGMDADYGVRVSPLNAEEIAVSVMVLGYLLGRRLLARS